MEQTANKTSPFHWKYSAKFEDELRQLRDLGFVTARREQGAITASMQDVEADVQITWKLQIAERPIVPFSDGFSETIEH